MKYAVAAVAVVAALAVVLYLVFGRGQASESGTTMKTQNVAKKRLAALLEKQAQPAEGSYEVTRNSTTPQELVDAFNTSQTVTEMLDLVQPSIDYFFTKAEQNKCAATPTLNSERFANLQRAMYDVTMKPDVDFSNQDVLYNYASIVFTFMNCYRQLSSSEFSTLEGTLTIAKDADGNPTTLTATQPFIKDLALSNLFGKRTSDILPDAATPQSIADKYPESLRARITPQILDYTVTIAQNAGFITPAEAASVRAYQAMDPNNDDSQLRLQATTIMSDVYLAIFGSEALTCTIEYFALSSLITIKAFFLLSPNGKIYNAESMCTIPFW